MDLDVAVVGAACRAYSAWRLQTDAELVPDDGDGVYLKARFHVRTARPVAIALEGTVGGSRRGSARAVGLHESLIAVRRFISGRRSAVAAIGCSPIDGFL